MAEQEETIFINKREFPPLFGDRRLHRLVKFYELLWWDTYGTKYRTLSFPALAGRFKDLSELSEMQIAALMIIHFEWRGATGEDDFTYKRLQNAMFPILWIPASVNQYATYLTNVEKVDFENEDAVFEFVRHVTCDIGDGSRQEKGVSLYQRALNAGILDISKRTLLLPGKQRNHTPQGQILW